jgi:epoxyqueuosine reductase
MGSELMNNGVLAVSPDVTPFFKMDKYPNIGWGSPWSHRHIAYAAGLGTFGLQDFLITEKGVAHRCGSFVVNLQLQPNHQRSPDIHANCLHYQGIPCDKCIPRCPVQAINQNGHDKKRCAIRVAKSSVYVKKKYDISIYGCGLCSVGVPCSVKNPIHRGEQ